MICTNSNHQCVNIFRNDVNSKKQILYLIFENLQYGSVLTIYIRLLMLSVKCIVFVSQLHSFNINES